MVDLLWSPRLTQENFSQYIDLENFEETARDTGSRAQLDDCLFSLQQF